MKILFNSAFWIIIILQVACTENTIITNPSPSIVQFAVPTLVLSESSGETQIKLLFSTATPSDGSISIKITSLNAIYGEDFITNPAASGGSLIISVNENQAVATFSITAIDNTIINGSKNLKFTMLNGQGGVTPGFENELDVTLQDDEGAPIDLSFITNGISIAENIVPGLPIYLAPNIPMNADGSITIILTDANQYNNRFTSIPSLMSGTTTINFSKGRLFGPGNNPVITIFPIDNLIIDGSLFIELKITGANGGANIGAINAMQVQIIDDESPAEVLLIGTWEERTYVASECVDPADNTNWTCTSGCDQIVFTETTVKFGGDPANNYTITGDQITITASGSLTWSVMFTVTETTLTIIQQDGVTDGGCKNVSTYVRL